MVGEKTKFSFIDNTPLWIIGILIVLLLAAALLWQLP